MVKIKCVPCNKQIEAIMTDGKEIYPHRKDLFYKVFWKCPQCNNYVGSHPDNRPLGSIVSKELKEARQYIHRYLDPICKTLGLKRGEVYSFISQRLGFTFHTAEIEDINVAREVYLIVKDLHDCLMNHASGYKRNAT